jgi:hypothetical protein
MGRSGDRGPIEERAHPKSHVEGGVQKDIASDHWERDHYV